MGKRYDLADVPGEMPATMVDEDVNLHQFQEIAQRTLEDLESGTAALADIALWRDWLALTGQVRTFYTRETIVTAWKQNTSGLCKITLEPAVVTKPTASHSWVDVPFSFQSPYGKLVRACTGRMSFQALPDGKFSVWMLVTIMENFVGHNHPDIAPHVNNGAAGDTANGTTNGSYAYVQSDGEDNNLNRYDAIIIGAGQCGLSAAGRLAAIGAKYALLERQGFAGRTWTQRYETVRQHTLREYNNLPFDRTWGEKDPNLLPGNLVAEGFNNYIKRYNINIWFNTEIHAATWNPEKRDWVIELQVHGEPRKISCKHLIVSIGGGSSLRDNLPHLEGTSEFQGILMGSGMYKHSRDWAGFHGMVVGSATMAHDIAHDMYKAGLRSVTMVQRNRTAIYPIEYVAQNQQLLYNTGIPTAVADALSTSMPNKIVRDITAANYSAQGSREPERFDALERAGFGLDRQTPMFDNIFNRFGGYYIDVGASGLIARGDVIVKSGVPIKRLTANAVEFEDGTETPVDVIVLATGQSRELGKELGKFLSMDVLRQIGDVWGLDEEGEVRGMMRTTGKDGQIVIVDSKA